MEGGDMAFDNTVARRLGARSRLKSHTGVPI
jgi:hypothetical protein